MNKSGAVGPIGAILLYIVFLVNWFVWLGGWINTVADLVIVNYNLEGLEAFLIGNLNFGIFIIMTLGMLGWMYFSSE